MIWTFRFYNDPFEFPLPPTHRFPMEKYRMVRVALQEAFVDDATTSFTLSPLASRRDIETRVAREIPVRFVKRKRK